MPTCSGSSFRDWRTAYTRIIANRYSCSETGLMATRKIATDERWKTCLGEVDTDLPWIMSSFFIPYRLNDKAKQLGEEMTQELKDGLVSRFDAKYDRMGHEVKGKGERER